MKIRAGKDNGADRLHKARFLLPPSGENKFWAKKIPILRKHIFAPQWQEELGVEHKFSESVWRAVHNRSVRLDFRNFVSSNYDADKKAEIKSAGKKEELTAHYDPATSVAQAVEALMNMRDLYRMVFPLTWTPDVILRLIHNYSYFEGVADPPKERIKIIERLTNEALAHNAEFPNLPPEGYNVLEKRLENVLESMGYSSIKPSILKKTLPYQQVYPAVGDVVKNHEMKTHAASKAAADKLKFQSTADRPRGKTEQIGKLIQVRACTK